MIGDHDGREDREAGFKPLINVVPLIGVLAAVMVVMMVAIPGRSASFVNDFGWGECWHCQAQGVLRLEVLESGLVLVNGREMTTAQLRRAPHLSSQALGQKDFALEVIADSQVEYSDVMRVVGILQELGAEDRQIHIWARSN